MAERTFEDIMGERTIMDRVSQALEIYGAVQERKHKRNIEAETIIGQKLRSAVSIWNQNPNDIKSIKEAKRRVLSIVQNSDNMVYGNSPIVNFASDTLFNMDTEISELMAVDTIGTDARTWGEGKYTPKSWQNKGPGEAKEGIENRILMLRENLDVLKSMNRHDDFSVGDIEKAIGDLERLKKFIGFDGVLGPAEIEKYNNTDEADLKSVYFTKQKQLDDFRTTKNNMEALVKSLTGRLYAFQTDPDAAEDGIHWDPEKDGNNLIKAQGQLKAIDETIRLAEIDLKEIAYDYTGFDTVSPSDIDVDEEDDPFGGDDVPELYPYEPEGSFTDEEIEASNKEVLESNRANRVLYERNRKRDAEKEEMGILDKVKDLAPDTDIDIDIGLSDEDLNDIKKLGAVGAGGYAVSKIPKAVEAVEKYKGRLAKAARYIKSATELSASDIKRFMNDSQLEKTIDTLEKIDIKKADADANLKGTLNKRRKRVLQGGVKYLAKKYGISEATAGKLLKSSGVKKWNVFQYKRNLLRKVPRAVSKKLSPYLIGSIITNAVGLESEGLPRLGVDVGTGLAARKTLVTMAKEVTPKLTKMLSTTAGKKALIGYLGKGGAKIVAGAVRGGGALSILSAAASAGLVAYDTYNFIMNWNKE